MPKVGEKYVIEITEEYEKESKNGIEFTKAYAINNSNLVISEVYFALFQKYGEELDDEIQVGDEVYFNGKSVFRLWVIYMEDGYFDGIGEDGRVYKNCDVDNYKKTGRHNAKLVEALMGDDGDENI